MQTKDMRQMHKTIVLLVALLALTARAASAQPAPWEPERLTAGWVFTPSMVIGGLWDSNVTVRAVRELQPSELVGYVNPRGELDFNGRRTKLNLGYSGQLERYREFAELNRYEQRGRLDLRHQTGPRLQIYGRAGVTAAPTTDRLDLGAGILPFIDIGSTNIDGSAGFRGLLSTRTRIESEYRYQNVEFDRDQTSTRFQYLRGGSSHGQSVALMRDMTSRLTLGGSYQFRYAEIGDDYQQFRVQNVGMEMAYRTGRNTLVRGGAGAAYLRLENTDISEIGPSYHASLEHLAGRTTLTLRYDNAFVPSIGFGGLSANQTVAGSARVPFAQGRYVVSGNVSYGRLKPLEVLGVGFGLNSLWTHAAFGYQATRWLRAEAFYTGTHQTSSARGQVDRSRVGVQFVTSKPVRIQ